RRRGGGPLGRGHERRVPGGQVGGERVVELGRVDRELHGRVAAARLRVAQRDFAGAVTATPCACSRSTTPFQQEASANAPCTSTTVGVDSDIPAPFDQRSERNAARISLAKSSGSSQAAKCPPRST